MDPKIQARADRRFEEALANTGAWDPRESYRGMLRDLKKRGTTEYESTVSEYVEQVLTPIAQADADPLRVWLEFGCRLAGRLHPGRTVVVDASGQARTYSPPATSTETILHLPEDRKVRAIPVGLPPEPTSAQKATFDLLALGKVKFSDE